ncbi:DotI/IcmL family type IV secretion protein [Legionella fallonii]|uniref:Similar to IcmL (DotI) protein [Macrophage killing IcmL/DotI domain] n=1 Tax=Legionella fallonii LLAP-10 TaxID=1212491 RepID=A0A098G435_9GAMM|nr:DotI/IcmL family type IV secretion protein [Legionella fallonii]CEG57237.1 similar to IcmL (DotI) protein [Macrophage killing IcmL/DotI domain] [Legionella fallonii LLAP-10]
MNILYRNFFVIPFGVLLSSVVWAQDHCSQLSDIKILSWAYESMLATYNLNFVNYKTQLPNAAKYYTKNAWMAYQKQLYLNIAPIQKEKLVISAGTANSPILLSKKNDIYKVQIPLLLNYQSQASKQTIKKIVTLDIVKDSHSDSCLKIEKITEQ